MSGRRCESTRAVIDGSEGRTLRRLGVRETRQMSRHLSHCEPCRRHAVLAQGPGVLAAGALVLRKSAGEMPARPVERPIALASRRRPVADDAAIASPGSDSLAVA